MTATSPRPVKMPGECITFPRVLEDDNSKIVAAHDGNRVDYDKKKPRAEIWIKEMEDKT